MISILRVILAPLALMGWQLAYPHNCLALAIPAATAVMIFLYVWHVRSVPLKVVADFYFAKRHLLYGFFYSRIRLFLFASVYAVFFSAALYLGATLWTPLYFGILTADALLIFFMFHGVRSWVQSSISLTDDAAPIVAKKFLAALNSLFLIIAFTWLSLDSVPPAYAQAGGTLTEMMRYAAEGNFTNCEYIQPFVSLARQLEGAKFYFAGAGLAVFDETILRWLIILMFSVAGAAPALAYSQFVLQLVAGRKSEEAEQ